ncbi:uncharacterized protein LOC106078496 isoform X1 [Biomphalaria glabrata]|uniref:Uncharacterized protein LOC106078496 isoform X1 n=2 Tax=Biomphalaria glabrata TaxID=6526 RepID=A0A9W2ZJR9_BIOGL|nr:uncharacterized protein LOC106078496 isoform X1 [Biomphalaria glabrata]
MHNHGLKTIKDQQLTNSCRLETVDASKKSEISSPFSESFKEVSLQQNSSRETDLNEVETLTESIRPHCINSAEFVQQVHPVPGLDLNGQMIRDCDVGPARLVESCLNTETPNDFKLILPNSLFEILPSCLSKTSYVPNVSEATLVKDLSNLHTVEREVKDDQDVPGDPSACLMSNSPAFCAYAKRPMDILVKTPINRMDPRIEPRFLDYETAHDVPCAVNTSSADSLSSILNVTLEQIQAVLEILPNPSGCNDQLSHSSNCMSIHSCPHLNAMPSHPFSGPITLASINTYSPLSPLLGQSCETLLTFSTNLRMSSRLDELNRNFLQSVNNNFLQSAFSPMNVNSSDVESNFSDTFHENVQIISDNWDKSQSACDVQHIENDNPTRTPELSEWASLPLKLNQINTEQICTECYYPVEENSHDGTFYGLEISPKDENCYKNLSNEKSSIAPCEDCSNSTNPAFDINKFCLDVEVVNHKSGNSHLASVRKYSKDHDDNLQQSFPLSDHGQKEYTEIENMPIVNSTGIHCKKDSGEFESIKTKPSDSILQITSDGKDTLTCHVADINLSESYLNNVEYQNEHDIDCIRPFKSCQVISTQFQSNYGCLIGFSDAQMNPCDTQSIEKHNVEHSSTSSDSDLPSGCCRTVCEKFKDSIINETNINCKCQTKVVNLKTSLASPSSEKTGSSIVSTLSETEEAFLSSDASANEADLSSEQSSADLSSEQSSAAAVFSHNALYTSHTETKPLDVFYNMKTSNRDTNFLMHSLHEYRPKQNHDTLTRCMPNSFPVVGEVPDAASDGLLSLLSTLRVLQHNLSQGHNLRLCALLLSKLELAREFLVLNKAPTFVAIREDLKLLCQTLARLISSSKRRLFISERSIDYRSDGHKVSTKQLRSYHHNKSQISQRLKPNSYEINFGTIKKVHTPQETDNKKSVLMLLNNRIHKRSSSQTKDGDYFNLPSPSVTNGIKLEYKSSQNPNCYGLGHTGFFESSSQESITSSDTWSNWTDPSNLTNMESDSVLESQLDREFDKYLTDMKPHVLKLPQKTERQKCAVWIKKLCEPVRGGVSARKTRNLYAQLMLQMLKKGSWDSPFDQKPESGALKPLPSYLIEKLPDWVEGELAETVGSSIFAKTLGIPAATSTRVSNSAEFLERPHTSMGHTLEKDPSLSLSPIRHTEGTQPRYSADDLSIELQRSPKISHRHQKGHHHSPSGDREKRLLPDVRVKESRENDKIKEVTISESDWSKPYSSTTSSTYSLLKGTTFYDDPSFLKPADREIAMRAKVIEAKFHEEKLKLQQRHDTAVQKILDRKNLEIEDMKNLYKAKTKDLEETIDKLERKVQNLIKETEFIKQSKDKQIAELKKIADDSNETRKNDYEKKLHELVTEFEQEKFDLQKQHTQNIQEILDDTNDRLQRMEAEYTNQTNITTDVIKELESRVQQLMNEVDSSLNQRSAVEKEKNDVLIKCEKLSNENERLRERLAQQERDQRKIIEAQEHEIKSLKNKTEASLEYLRQEHSMATSKAADTIKDLEEKIEQLKKSLKDSEEHRQRLIREMEQNHQQDKLHLENLHDKQIRNLKKEIEQMDADWHKKVMKLEQLVKDKDQEIHKVKEQKQQQKLQAEQALEDFKSEIERNQNKIYDEMKQQMQQVEIDLQKSKQAREKQSKEFAKQLEDEKYSHQHELAELKMNYEADKSQFMREFHMQKEFLLSEHERDLENLKELHRTEVLSLEARMKEKQDKAEKSAIDNERCIRELREDLLQANQLRKQQLVELGLLREEEKQKMHRDHEAEIARVRGEMEQQRLALQRTHSTDMENVLEKTNQRLIALEKDFTERANKSSETITELQAVIKQLRDDLQRCKENYENKMTDLKRNHEDEKRSLKKKFSHSIEGVKNELEVQRSRGNNAERRLQKAESDLEERLTELKIHYEEKLRGLVPLDVKKELEDTIAALKSQVNSLHLRSTLLQEELDSRNGLSSFGTLTSSVIKSAV